MRRKNSNEQKTYKIVLLGDAGVGKSSIMERFIFDKYTAEKTMTLGSNFHEKYIAVGEKVIRIALWDTAGQEKYAPLARFYYNSADAAFIVYDVNIMKTLARAKNWLNELKENCKSGILLVLVGNKIDIEEREVGCEDAVSFAKKDGLLYFETSAKLGTGIDNLFNEVASILEKIDNSKSTKGKKRLDKRFNNINTCQC